MKGLLEAVMCDCKASANVNAMRRCHCTHPSGRQQISKKIAQLSVHVDRNLDSAAVAPAQYRAGLARPSSHQTGASSVTVSCRRTLR